MVPENTLRDRVLVKIDPETTVMGKVPLFSQYDKAKLLTHFETTAAYGYGYTLQECTDIATEFTIQLGKRTADKPLTMKWMRGLRERWPDMQKFSPRALEYTMAKMTKATIVMKYFDNLEQSLKRYGLIDKPHLILNIDEKGMSVDHKLSHDMVNADYCPPSYIW
ncbi:hypothetical protein KUTeg_010111 [Tegillarca granosa]|uniref:Uncharacterized protein n=1 Tax=Tegillarca granosa TaxID=220873 RepID=A0ABQ9F5U1_TEGGR|nr:hypothetical protein KUTeg_010111 [Tegillarca granosa]